MHDMTEEQMTRNVLAEGMKMLTWTIVVAVAILVASLWAYFLSPHESGW